MDKIENHFSTNKRALEVFASTITGNYQDAQEVVQEVFVECLERPPEGLTKAYLFRSVRNRSLNKCRSRKRFFDFVSKWKEYCERFLPVIDHNQHEFLDSLKTLSFQQKEIIILRIKLEMKVTEIAEILNIPEGTVKSRLNTALRVIRKSMGEKR